MQKILKILFSLSLLPLLASCNLVRLDDFSLVDASVVEFEGMSKARLELTIESRACLKVRVTEGHLDLMVRGEKVGELTLANQIVLPARETTTVTVDVNLSFASPLSALRAVKTLIRNPEVVSVSGYGEGRIWCFRRRIVRENVPISKFIDIFGPASNYFTEL
ncbi:MAG: hypothetical protein SOZ00_05360 [Tidjanibacter sp.]|nr:hypothetical protein [Tidjanibacter sp.]